MNDVPRNMQKGECKIFYKNGELTNKWRFGKKWGEQYQILPNVLSTKLIQLYFQGCIYYIFMSKRGLLCLTRRNVFYFSNQMLRKSKFGIVDIQTSWLYQMPNHKTNIFYWITWVGSISSLLMKFGHSTKGKVLSKNSIKTATWKLVPGPFMLAKNWVQPLLENGVFLSKLLIWDNQYHLSKFVQISMQTSLDSKRAWYVLGHIFHKVFW